MSIIFVISAPSGSGKSTLVNRLLRSDSNLEFGTSVTTRPPRMNEVDGEEYRFVRRDEFLEMRDKDEFLEWAEVFGHLYGTPRSALDHARRHGRDLLLDIDVKGAGSLIEKLPETVKIFILPPSRSALEQRLRERCSEDENAIKRRLGEASREVGQYRSYDHVVINENLNESFQRLYAILVAERGKRRNMERAIEPILRSFGIQPDADVEATS